MKLDETIEALKRGEIVHAGERVLCAVSGGADSVALLAIMRDAADAAGMNCVRRMYITGYAPSRMRNLNLCAGCVGSWACRCMCTVRTYLRWHSRAARA